MNIFIEFWIRNADNIFIFYVFLKVDTRTNNNNRVIIVIVKKNTQVNGYYFYGILLFMYATFKSTPIVSKPKSIAFWTNYTVHCSGKHKLVYIAAITFPTPFRYTE